MKAFFSDLKPMISGVPQWSVLGPLLFVVYANNLNENMQGMVVKFADNAKIDDIVDSAERYQELKRDLQQLGKWTEECQIEFNSDKCKAFHFGTLNQARTFTVNGKVMGSVA